MIDRLEVVETARFSCLCLRSSRQRWAGRSLARFTGWSEAVDYGDAGLRALLEPHLRKARRQRGALPADRHCCFPLREVAFDAARFPLDAAARECLGAGDLSLVHAARSADGPDWKRSLLLPLLDARRRERLGEIYDDFMRRVALPAVAPPGCVKARYQAFPCCRVHAPGEARSAAPRSSPSFGRARRPSRAP